MTGSIGWSLVTAVFADWHDLKTFVERAANVGTDSLHVIAGVLLQLLFAAVVRRPLSSWLPWLLVLLSLLFNEIVDLWVEQWPSLAMQLGESARDLVLTMFLPTALLVVVRRWPHLISARR